MNYSISPIICAMDTPDLAQVLRLTDAIKNSIGAVKLGLEFFTAHGPTGVKEVIALGVPVFLDMKFHDIPNTVAGALREAVKMGVSMITVHGCGGKDMLSRASDTVRDTAAQLGIQAPVLLAITVLTSMNQLDLTQTGVTRKVEDQVVALATLANESGVGGIVCSPHEIALVRTVLGQDKMIVTPGIRFDGAATQDQKRTMTPQDALKAGANYLVIGRPITASASPVDVVRSLAQALSQQAHG